MQTKVTYFVDYYDLEFFVKTKYGHDIEIAAMEECSNDSSLTFDVSNNKSLAEYEFQQHVAWVMDGRFWPFGTGNILNQLCIDGHIPAGTYVIDVSW